MKPNFVFLVKRRTLPGQFLEIEICRDGGVVVDIAGRARQSIEIREDESPDAVELKRFREHVVEF